jgi:hypothetical protein
MEKSMAIDGSWCAIKKKRKMKVAGGQIFIRKKVASKNNTSTRCFLSPRF